MKCFNRIFIYTYLLKRNLKPVVWHVIGPNLVQETSLVSDIAE